MKKLSRKEIIAQNEISEIKEFNLGGYPQKVLIDGKSKSNTVVIFLHGGPGSPIPFSVGCRGLFPEITDKLTMVYWDQLGCGINDYPIDDSFTINHFVEMTIQLVKEIRQLFPNNKILLFGVSWGSILALKASLECTELINGIITYGQVLYELTYNKDVYSALENSNLSAKKKQELAQIKNNKTHTAEETKKIMGWVQKYTEGYNCKAGEKAPLFPIIMGMLTSPDYKLKDFKAMVVNGYLKNNSLMNELITTDLRKELEQVTIPYQILQGSTDIVTSTTQISEFVTELNKPNITCRIIADCGHLPNKNGMDEIVDTINQF